MSSHGKHAANQILVQCLDCFLHEVEDTCPVGMTHIGVLFGGGLTSLNAINTALVNTLGQDQTSASLPSK